MSDLIALGDGAENVVLVLTRRTDRRFSVVWTEEDGVTPIPIASVFGRVLGDEGAVIEDVADVSTITPAGTVDVAFVGASTAGYPLTDHGRWSLVATAVNGEIKRLLRGSVIVEDPED